MEGFKVISILPLGENTAVMLDGGGEPFRNGIIIEDEKGNAYEVITVNMIDGAVPFSVTSLLIKGAFSAERVFIRDKQKGGE